MERLYCPECGNYLEGGDGSMVDCHCGWRQERSIGSDEEEIEQLRQRVAELEKENSIERNLRIGVEAGFDCANEELGRLKARVENLMLESEQWRVDCQTYCDAMHKREAAITSLQAERDALKKEVAQWKNHHETEVRRARILKERTDMPIERVQAYEQWGKDMAERDKATQYWNIAEGRCDALMQQRDDLVKALESVLNSPLTKIGFTEYMTAKNAIASVKEK